MVSNCNFTQDPVSSETYSFNYSNSDTEAVFITDITTIICDTQFLGQKRYVNVSQNSLLSNGNQNNFTNGRAITAFQSDIIFEGKCTFRDNHARTGGALHTIESKVQILGEVVMKYNMATDAGGGVYLHQSELSCLDKGTLLLKNNIAINNGGGIYATSSSIKFIHDRTCLLYTSPSPRDATLSRMPSSA